RVLLRGQRERKSILVSQSLILRWVIDTSWIEVFFPNKDVTVFSCNTQRCVPKIRVSRKEWMVAGVAIVPDACGELDAFKQRYYMFHRVLLSEPNFIIP